MLASGTPLGGSSGRWWAVVAVAALVAAVPAVALEVRDDGLPHAAVVVHGPGGELLTRVRLPENSFAVSYRNSIYGTVAEARYAVRPDGTFEIVELAADQLAVLEEYYAVPTRPRRTPPGDRRAWSAPPDPARPPVFTALDIAATDLGERTLLVPGNPPVPLWRLVGDDNVVVTLKIEEPS